MRWSKLKQLIEGRLAPSVAGRVDVHAARYRRADDSDGRCWITIDGQEVASFCSFRAYRRQGELASELRTSQGTTDYRDPEQAPGYYAAGRAADAMARREGSLTQYEFYGALWDSLSLPIETALRSDEVPIRALAMLDRRLGKRRLRALALDETEHPMVQRCLALRREAEGLAGTVEAAAERLHGEQ